MKSMNILVTGSNGQLGNEIKQLGSQYPNFKFNFTDVAEMDITNQTSVMSACEANKIDAIINCAAYTAVDKAESDEALCAAINATGVANLVAYCEKVSAKLVHVSTDYVFNGENFRPIIESDPIHPMGVYGQTKAEGEQHVLESKADAIVIRTSWLYSSFGANFVKTIRKYAIERGQLKVVFDQIGTPTYAADLAKTILEILSNNESISTKGRLYHYSNEGVASWYDFAKAIVKQSDIPCVIEPVESTQFPTPAKRPHYSVLNKSKIKADFDIEIPYWMDSLKKCIAILDEQKSI